MKILKNIKINDSIDGIIIYEFFNGKNNQDELILKKIVQSLLSVSKKQIYFQFRREGMLFFSSKELEYYRNYIPEFFNKNGKYKILYKLDDIRFDSIGILPINDDTLDLIPILWKYFEDISFFLPNDSFSWEEFIAENDKIINDVDGISQLSNKYSNSIFIKGHDGAYLIFNYNKDSYDLPDLSDYCL